MNRNELLSKLDVYITNTNGIIASSGTYSKTKQLVSQICSETTDLLASILAELTP